MDKLKLAHEYFMKHVNTDQYKHLDDEDLISWSFDYVDAMQAEADKRECKERPDVLKEEWQLDWSQAPRFDVIAWDISEHGQARWIASDGGYYLAPSFDYQGNWQNSLRKRPQ